MKKAVNFFKIQLIQSGGGKLTANWAFGLCQLLLWTSFVFAYEPQFADHAKRVRLRWRGEVVKLSLSNSLRQSAANVKSNSDVTGAVRRSLRSWEAVTNVKFVIVWSDKTSISPADGEGDGASLITIAATPENVAPFQGDAAVMPGRTRTFYNNRGNINEADIVLNPYQQFSTDGSFGTFDLEAAMTHEIGHLLGLDHSAVIAATMYAQQGKNGTFSLPAFAPRTLAEDDRAGIRALYGVAPEDETCCGAVTGKLTEMSGEQLSDWQVWAEDLATGRLFASVVTNDRGDWKIGGLPNGKYRIVVQAANASAETVGEIIIEKDKTIVANHKLAPRARSLNSLLIGYNGQLSELAVPLGAGRAYTIFAGGENVTLENLKTGDVSLNSPFAQIFKESLMTQDFDSVFPVLSFALRLNSELPAGEYSLGIQKADGEIVYLLGCFSVE